MKSFGKISHSRKAAVLAVLLSGCMYGVPAMAANLVATVPSDYSSSQLGMVTGSRVTTKVDDKVQVGAIKDLNRDPGVYTFNRNGKSEFALRQYTYSTTDLEATQIFSTSSSDLTTPNQKGIISAVPNMHAAAANKDFVFAVGYDLGKIGVAKIDGNKLTEVGNASTATTLMTDIKKYCKGNYTKANACAHGEAIMAVGNDVYVVASVNPEGGYDPYDDSYLMHYTVDDRGILTFADYARIGKNNDQARINLYNNKLLVTSIGGMQNYGSGNADTAIHVVSMNNGALTPENSQKITVPSNVQYDFRDLKVLPNGTAYVLTYNLSATSAGMSAKVYKTTISNLVSKSPKKWEEVVSGDYDGWFGKIYADYYTKRLWFEDGNTLTVYTDGSATPAHKWDATSFSTNSQYYNFNSVVALDPDTVAGDTAKLTASVPKKMNSNAVLNPQADYYKPITGTADDTAYASVTSDNKNYAFAADKTIYLKSNASGDLTTNVLADIDAHSGNDITINAGSHNLQLQAVNYVADPSGIYVGNGKNVTVNAGKVNIITAGYAGGNSLTNAIWNDAPATGSSTITINAPVNISMSGGHGGNGIAIEKTDRWGEASNAATASSKIIINGNATIAGTDNETWGIPLNSENVYSRFNNSGILTSVDNSEVDINGNVDFTVYGNGVTTNAVGSKVKMDGGKIVVPKGMNYGYYSLAAFQGGINMNTGADGATPGANAVQLDGDIFTLGTGKVNVALTTANSYLNGIVDNGGTANLWLQNGAQWTNNAQNTRYSEDNEDVGAGQVSHVSKFVGGSDASHAGIIYQKAASDLAIDNFSGNAMVIYAHDNGTPTNITGGNTKITSAATGSGIVMRTDNSGIDVANKDTVNSVLDALAKKLYYKNYAAEKNLAGTVEIAEGLTASAVAATTSTISFDSTTGQGSRGTSNDPQSKSDFTTTITGADDKEYTDANVEKKTGIYTFTKDSNLTANDTNTVTTASGMTPATVIANVVNDAGDVTIDAKGKTLSLKATSQNNTTSYTAGIVADNNMTIGAKNLKILALGYDTNNTTGGTAGIYVNNTKTSGNNVNITGDVTINAYDMGSGKSYGIFVCPVNEGGTSTLTINGNLTMKGENDTSTTKNDGIYGVGPSEINGNGTLGYGINLNDKSTAGGSKININGKTDLAIDGTGVVVTGNVNNVINIREGNIVTKSAFARALSAVKGTINMGMNEAATSSNGKNVNVSGIIYASTNGTINLGLDSKNSLLTGNIMHKDDTTGTTNLYLGSGTWNNIANTSDTFKGSKVNKLIGSNTTAKQGVIFQNDTHPITIDDYSGNSMVIYAHDSTTPTTIIGGDTKITKAETGSNITLMTDNTGLNATSSNYKDKNLVSATLNALANKLYYTAYSSGEKNLNGTVEIAEGLTATSASMQTGAITFKDADGQGQYVYTPAVPDSQETTDFTTPVTGYLAKDEAYINAGVLKKDTEKYEFTKDTTSISTNITDANDKIAGGPWVMVKLGAAVYNNQLGAKNTVLNLHDNKLNITDVTDGATAAIAAINPGSKVEINDAGAMNVSAKSTAGGMTAGVFVNGGGEIDIHNGGDNKKNKILTVRADTSNTVSGAVIKAMNGNPKTNSTINIDGLVDVLADGDTTDGLGSNEAVSSVASTINIGGGTIKAINGAWAAIRAYGEFTSQNTGTVNVNVTKDADGKANGADDNKTVIEGDIVTNGGMGTKGCISVGLSTDDSYWLGNYADTRGYGVTQGQLGAVNLFMKNGSHWKGFGNGTMNVQMEGAGTNWTGFNIGDNMQLTLKDGAIWHNAITADQKDQSNNATNAKIKYLTSDKGVIDMTGANVFVASSTSLTGASTSGKNSSITESTNGITGNVVVDNYSGNSTVIYAHDVATPNVMKGGNFTVTKAAEGSKITMLTDNSGVDNTDADSINATLDALAKKLYYTAYTTGEKNLTGTVEIAEGLTATSVSRETGNIVYDSTTGEGSLDKTTVNPGPYYPDSQTTDKFSTAITGDMSLDKEYLRTGVLRKDTGKYEFTKPSTTITTTGRNTYGGDHWLLVHANLGVYGDNSSKTTTLNLHDNALTVDMTSTGTTAAVAAVGGKTQDDYMNGKYGSVEINNPGAITINAKSTDGGMTAAVFANGGGHVTIHNGGKNQENKVLTARAETATATNGAVIKTMNGNRSTNSNITIDGLVDVLADGDTSDGFGANEAVSAVASTINIGGGTIKAINGAWAAIRAYGEFVSSNTGTVNVNVTKDAEGNANGAGTNKTVIDGDFVTNGGMGTKGCISVGLSTDDSYWLGNYADTRGYGVTQGQLGAVNLFMKNGSHWKGFGNGTMNVQMEGNGTNWTGFNVGDTMQLTLKDGAIWHNAITADQKDRNGDVVSAKVKYLTSDKGVIDMTGANVFVANSSSLSGPTSGKSSSITESTNGITGNVVVDNYSGNSTVIYAHDVATPNVMKGGNFTVTQAAENSKITMLTDNSGVDLMEESSINATLDALAKKLFYTAYTTGERNLAGTVEIAEGLTAASATKETGNIVYDSSTGEGSLDTATVKPGPIYPDNQKAETYSNVITGDYSKDVVYKKSGVMKKDSTYQFTKANTDIVLNPAGEAVVDAKNFDVNMYLNKNNMTLKNTSNDSDKVTTGIRALNGKNVTINDSGNITINVSNSKGVATGIKADKGIVRIHNGKNAVMIDTNKVTSSLTTSLAKDLNLPKGSLIALDAEDGGKIILDGAVKSSRATVGLVADKGSINAGGVDLSGVTTGLAAANGGNIVTGATNITVKNNGNAAIADSGSKISLGAEGVDSTINGNIEAENDSTINTVLATSGSSFTGAVAKDASSTVNMTLKNKALWNNTGTQDTNITSLTGGDTMATAGAIRQKSASPLNIGTLSGNVEVIYNHDSTDPTNIDGGNVTVAKATKTNGTNAGILVSTDNAGINTSDTTSVKKALNALANKITYTASTSGEGNLNGKVQIAEGLTANSFAQKIGTMAFSNTTGQGSLVATSIASDPAIIYGPKETAMMRGAKSAMLSSAMIWRSENDDLMQRMENLRAGNEDAGIWARMYAGKQDYNNGTTDLENNYRTYQVGFDKNVGHGWRVGVAASYNDGSSTYELNGRGDQSATSGSLYGTWFGDKGHYFGLQLKGSKIRNNYTAYNDMGHKLTGDYDTWAESMTAEYGRRIGMKNGTWIEPQAKFSLGHINSSDYNANSDFLNSDGTNKDMSVSQDAYNSAIGRIGLGYGIDVNNFNAYARVLLAHEFGGAFTSAFSATGEPEGGTRVDLGDTWTEVQLGISKKFNKTSSGYASFEKSFGGDLQDRWRVDAGLRFTF